MVFSVWRGSGERSSFSELMAAAATHDVVLLGETHYDAVAHKLQEIIFARLSAARPVVLSLEMFETDVQHVLDEYLNGLTREQDLLNDARPWANYKAAYRPMVELAKEAGLRVVAANAPRRYVSAIGRHGEEALGRSVWGVRAHADLPPLPLPKPSAAYMAQLLDDPEVMPRGAQKAGGATASSGTGGGGCPHIGLRSEQGLLAPMKLWDASMAYGIAQALAALPAHQVVHICGSDHCKAGLGIVEMLAHYRPTASPLVIVMYPERECHRFSPERHAGTGDFVVLTDESASSAPAPSHAGGAGTGAGADTRPLPSPPPPIGSRTTAKYIYM